MSILGKGAVAIWHDLKPEAKEDFYQWHAREHMPERAAIPGMTRGRRYSVVSGAPEYFNIYDADDMTVLGGKDYLDRLNAPTPWTRQVVASFVDVARSVCDVRFSGGVGDGGHMRTLRFNAPEAVLAALSAEHLPALTPLTGISAVHLLVADEATSNIATTERAARGDATRVPRHIVLIEGINRACVEAASAHVESAMPNIAIDSATYVLEHATA